MPIAPETVRDAKGNPTTNTTITRLRAGDALDRFLDVFEQARQAGIPIYTIDRHGPASPESVSNIGNINSPGAREGLVRQIQLEHDFLHMVAINTGGRAFVNQSNMSWATEQIVSENGSYYLLGYYPEPWVADGEFHPIDVKVLRPGVRVRAREGYMTEKKLPAALARPPRGRTILRVAASSELLEARGSVHMPLEVPRLAGESLAIASLVLAAPASAGVRIAHIGDSDKTLPFQPTTRRVFSTSDRIAVFTRIFAATPGSVTATLSLRNGESAVRNAPLALTPAKADKQGLDGQAVLSLSGLAPGTYVLEVAALGQPGLTASRAVSITVK